MAEYDDKKKKNKDRDHDDCDLAEIISDLVKCADKGNKKTKSEICVNVSIKVTREAEDEDCDD